MVYCLVSSALVLRSEGLRFCKGLLRSRAKRDKKQTNIQKQNETKAKNFQTTYYDYCDGIVTLMTKTLLRRVALISLLIGLLTPELPLLNYLLLVGKIYLWGCRRNKELPSICGFKSKVKLKYEMEKYICIKNNNLDMFKKKWAT